MTHACVMMPHIVFFYLYYVDSVRQLYLLHEWSGHTLDADKLNNE